MKKFLLGGLVILLLLLGVGLYYYNTPAASAANQSADQTLTASALYRTYEADEAAGNRKFIDQVLVVAGRVGETSEDESGAPVLILREADAFNGVLCTLEPNQAKKVQTLKVGDQVTVKGICTGMLMDVVLNRAVLVE